MINFSDACSTSGTVLHLKMTAPDFAEKRFCSAQQRLRGDVPMAKFVQLVLAASYWSPKIWLWVKNRYPE